MELLRRFEDIMTSQPRNTLPTSMFSLSEELRLRLLKFSTMETLNGTKKSINSAILDSLEWYFSFPDDELLLMDLPSGKLRHSTVRMTPEMKEKLARAATVWQLKKMKPISMNVVLHSAILGYLDSKKVP